MPEFSGHLPRSSSLRALVAGKSGGQVMVTSLSPSALGRAARTASMILVQAVLSDILLRDVQTSGRQRSRLKGVSGSKQGKEEIGNKTLAGEFSAALTDRLKVICFPCFWGCEVVERETDVGAGRRSSKSEDVVQELRFARAMKKCSSGKVKRNVVESGRRTTRGRARPFKLADQSF